MLHPRHPKRLPRPRHGVVRAPRPLVERIEPRVLLAAQPTPIEPAGSFDPNDEISEARPVANNTTLPNELLTSGTDVNMYSLSVTFGQTITFDTDPIPTVDSTDTVLRLFRSNGTEIAYNDDGAAPGEPLAYPAGPNFGSYIQYSFEFTGIVYIGVSCTSNDNYDPVSGFN